MESILGEFLNGMVSMDILHVWLWDCHVGMYVSSIVMHIFERVMGDTSVCVCPLFYFDFFFSCLWVCCQLICVGMVRGLGGGC